MKLDGIAGRIVDEGLAVRADGDGVPDFEALGAQLVHHGVEITDPDGEMLAVIRGNRSLDQMHLLGAQVDPCPGDSEVRTIFPQRPAQHVGVEFDAFSDVGNVERTW